MKKVLIALALLTVSACAVTPQTPKAEFPADTQLVCHQGWWTIISPSLEIMGVFSTSCGPQV